jgi:AcrR family transcriptional regulator
MSDSSPQRQRILESAVEILATQGQSGLNVRAVAAASGFSTTGIYTWFGGKEGLLEAIYADGFTHFRAFVASADSDPDAASRLRRACELYWEWALGHPTHYLLMFAGVPSAFAPSASASAIADESFDDHLRRIQAVTDDDCAHHIWATLHGYAMLQIAMPNTELPEAIERFQGGLDRLLGGLARSGD